MKLQTALQEMLNSLKALGPQIGVEFVADKQEFDIQQYQLDDQKASQRRFYNLGLGDPKDKAEVIKTQNAEKQVCFDATTDPYPANCARALWNLGTRLISDLNSTFPTANLIKDTGFLLQHLRYLDAATWVPKVIDARSYEVVKAFRDFIEKISQMDPQELSSQIPGGLGSTLIDLKNAININLEIYETLLPANLAQSQPIAEQADKNTELYNKMKPALAIYASHSAVVQATEATQEASLDYTAGSSFADKLQKMQDPLAEKLGPTWREDVKRDLAQLKASKLPDSWVIYQSIQELALLRGESLPGTNVLEKFKPAPTYKAEYSNFENILSRFNNISLHLDVLQFLDDIEKRLAASVPAEVDVAVSRDKQIEILNAKIQELTAWEFASPKMPAEFSEPQQQAAAKGLASLLEHYQSSVGAQIQVLNERVDALTIEAARENVEGTLSLKKSHEAALQSCKVQIENLTSEQEQLTTLREKNITANALFEAEYNHALEQLDAEVASLIVSKKRLADWKQQLEGAKLIGVAPLEFAELATILGWDDATKHAKLNAHQSMWRLKTPEQRFMNDKANRLVDIQQGLATIEQLLSEKTALQQEFALNKDAKVAEMTGKRQEQAHQLHHMTQELSQLEQQKGKHERQIVILDEQYNELAFHREMIAINAELQQLADALEADKGIPTLSLKYVEYPQNPDQRQAWNDKHNDDLEKKYGVDALSSYADKIASQVNAPLEANKRAFAELQQKFVSAKQQYKQDADQRPQIFKTIADQIQVKEFLLGLHESALAGGRELGGRLLQDQQQYTADKQMMDLYKTFETSATQYLAARHEKFWFRDLIQTKAAALFRARDWEPSQSKRETYIDELQAAFKASLTSRNYGTLLAKIDEGLREFESRTTDEQDPDYRKTLKFLLDDLKEDILKANPALRPGPQVNPN